jgi:hypothetical protein
MKMYVARELPPTATTTRGVSFPVAVRVGNLTLPAGDYRVKHVTDSNRHLMIFGASNETNEYRVPCRLEPLPERSKTTEQQYELDASGQNRLIALTFEGEQFKHVF